MSKHPSYPSASEAGRRIPREAAANSRREVARQLHDTLSQSLTAIYLNTKVLEQKLRQEGSAHTPQAAELGETIHRAVQELHTIMSRLVSEDPGTGPPR